MRRWFGKGFQIWRLVYDDGFYAVDINGDRHIFTEDELADAQDFDESRDTLLDRRFPDVVRWCIEWDLELDPPVVEETDEEDLENQGGDDGSYED